MAKDLIRMASNSQHTDFRTTRIILDGIRQGSIKGYKNEHVLSALTRMILLESTRLVSDPRMTARIVSYDTRTH